MKRYSLLGIDGNAYCVMTYVTKAMRHEGYSAAEIDAYCTDAESSDYDHLLQASIRMINQINKKLEG